MAKVIMYSTAFCPYCIMAERLLLARGVTEIEKIRVEYVITFAINRFPLFLHYWQICLPPCVDPARKIMHKRESMGTQGRAGFAGRMNATPVDQHNRLAFEFLQLRNTLLEFVGRDVL